MAKVNNLYKATPYAVSKIISSLGSNLKEARLRRNLTIKSVAEKLGVDPKIIHSAESGKASTGIAVYMALLWVYDLLDDAENLANPLNDTVGLQLGEQKQRVRKRKVLSNDF